MERQFKIVERDVTAVDVALEHVSNVVGIGLGFAAGYYGNLMLPVAKNVGEKILRHMAIDLGSTVIAAASAKTIAETANEAVEATQLKRLLDKGLVPDTPEEESATTK